MKLLQEQIKDVVYHDTDVEEILEIIRQEVSEAIPKKGLFSCATQQELQENPYIGVGRLEGYNQALSDIRTALQKKGLI